MVHPVVDGNFAKVVRIHTIETPDVVAVFERMGASLVMRIDAATRAEVVLGGVRVELVQPQNFFALDNLDSSERN